MLFSTGLQRLLVDNNTKIEFSDVSLGYRKKVVVRHLNLTVEHGSLWAFIGPNGSGKTTLLRAMLGFIKPGHGSIAGKGDIRFAYCKQRQSLDDIFPLTVQEAVLMGRVALIGPLGKVSSADIDKVKECLDICSIAGLKNEQLRTLSGGQKQRVLIARALAAEPNFLLLDEPTTDLDIKGTHEILSLLTDINTRMGLTVVLVSHEIQVALQYARQFLFLQSDGTALPVSREKITDAFLSDFFSTDMRGTVPEKA